jgi:hypothetical protein
LPAVFSAHYTTAHPPGQGDFRTRLRLFPARNSFNISTDYPLCFCQCASTFFQGVVNSQNICYDIHRFKKKSCSALKKGLPIAEKNGIKQT